MYGMYPLRPGLAAYAGLGRPNVLEVLGGTKKVIKNDGARFAIKAHVGRNLIGSVEGVEAGNYCGNVSLDQSHASGPSTG